MGLSRKGKPLGGGRGSLLEFKCKTCDKSVVYGAYTVKVKLRQYCSRECWRKAVKGKREAHRYTIPLLQRRQIMKVRDQKCEDCGWNEVPQVLELHHKDRDTQNGTPENLMLLCPNCHQIHHFKTSTGRFNKAPRNQKKTQQVV